MVTGCVVTVCVSVLSGQLETVRVEMISRVLMSACSEVTLETDVVVEVMLSVLVSTSSTVKEVDTDRGMVIVDSITVVNVCVLSVIVVVPVVTVTLKVAMAPVVTVVGETMAATSVVVVMSGVVVVVVSVAVTVEMAKTEDEGPMTGRLWHAPGSNVAEQPVMDKARLSRSK